MGLGTLTNSAGLGDAYLRHLTANQVDLQRTVDAFSKSWTSQLSTIQSSIASAAAAQVDFDKLLPQISASFLDIVKLPEIRISDVIGKAAAESTSNIFAAAAAQQAAVAQTFASQIRLPDISSMLPDTTFAFSELGEALNLHAVFDDAAVLSVLRQATTLEIDQHTIDEIEQAFRDDPELDAATRLAQAALARQIPTASSAAIRWAVIAWIWLFVMGCAIVVLLGHPEAFHLMTDANTLAAPVTLAACRLMRACNESKDSS